MVYSEGLAPFTHKVKMVLLCVNNATCLFEDDEETIEDLPKMKKKRTKSVAEDQQGWITLS